MATENDAQTITEAEHLTRSQAAALIGRSEWTLGNWHRKGIGPIARKHGKSLMYFRSEVEAWMELHKEQLEKNKLPV